MFRVGIFMNSFTKVRKTENDICFFKKRGPFRRFESLELSQYNEEEIHPSKIPADARS